MRDIGAAAEVELGEVLRHRSNFITISDSKEYKRCRVMLHGKGVVLRDLVLGAELAIKRQQLCRPNDFLVAEIDAKLGGYGLVPSELAGAIVSSHYFLFEVDDERLLPEFLGWYARTTQFLEQVTPRGSTNYAAIRPRQVLSYRIPLPPLTEQHKVIKLVNDCQTWISEAVGLRAEADADSEALATSVIGRRLSGYARSGCLADVLAEKPRNGWSPRCDNVDGGTPVLSLGAVTGFRFRPSEHKLTAESTEPGKHYWLEHGDLLVTRSNTERLLGHAAIYEGDPSPCIYPDLMMRLKVDPLKADTRFVYYWLRTPWIRAIIEGAGKGTSSTMKKITQKVVMALPFPESASLAEQVTAARSLDKVLSAIAGMRETQKEVAQDLSAIMPSLLEQAFRMDTRSDGERSAGMGAAAAM